MKNLITENEFILMEAAVVETLRRDPAIELHETLVNAPLIYDPATRPKIGTIYQSFMNLSERTDLPMLICTPTWRTNKARVDGASFFPTINRDAVAFLQELREASTAPKSRIKIGGMIGCKNDCYLPEEGVSTEEARLFHSWQIDELCAGDVDFLLAETIPFVPEALGIAQAMGSTGTPYIISFVISRDGRILDGTSLADAIALIDSNTQRPPLGYMINCAHPSFLCPETQPPAIFERLIGYQANASSLDHCDLENATELQTDSLTEWGDLMLNLNEQFGVKIMGGCCGTTIEHLEYLVKNRKT